MISLLPAMVAGPHLAIPGSYWLMTFLHWLTFVLHLLAMNVLFGVLILLLVSGSSPLRRLLFDNMVKLFPTAMAATITLGVAPLLFTQVIYGKFFYSASIISGWQWFSLIPVLLLVYYLLYAASLSGNMTTGKKLMLLFPAGIGLAYLSFTFTSISDLAEKPALWAAMYTASPEGFSINPDIGEYIFRWTHMLAGAITVAGLVIMLFTVYHPKVEGNHSLRQFGAKMFLMGVMAAAVLAIIYLLVIPRDIFTGFLQSAGLHAVSGAIVLNIIAAYLAYRSSRAARPRNLILSASLLVFLGVFCMVIARHYLRLVFLEGAFDPGGLPTAFQAGPFVMFAVTFVAGLVVMAWMLHLFFRARQAEV